MYQESEISLRDVIKKSVRERIWTRDFYVGLGLVAFCLLLIFYLIPYGVGSQRTPRGDIKPTFFPYLMTFSLLALSLSLIYNSPKTSKDISRAKDKEIRSMTFICMGTLFIYYIAIITIGMAPASVLIMIILRWIFGAEKWIRSILLSFGFVVVLYLFFAHMAQVDVPKGFLLEGVY